MPIFLWFLLSTIIWWLGRAPTTGDLFTDLSSERKTMPPTILFFLCGSPSNPNLSKGVMNPGGLGYQVTSIIMALCGINFLLLGKHELGDWSVIICLLGSSIIGVFITVIAPRIWPSQLNQDDNNNQEK
jgi:hypothetical protein